MPARLTRIHVNLSKDTNYGDITVTVYPTDVTSETDITSAEYMEGYYFTTSGPKDVELLLIAGIAYATRGVVIPLIERIGSRGGLLPIPGE